MVSMVQKIETVSRVRHLTESLPLSVYNRIFSQVPESDGRGHVYYDATKDFYGELPPSRAFEVKGPEDMESKKVLLRFD